MKKVININFQGRVTPIEETAYDVLKQYVESLRQFFANEEGKDEIINDIESRIAELFSERLKKGSTCITDNDVESIIAGMGRPEDFENEDNIASPIDSNHQHHTHQTNTEASKSRGSLYRDINDKILGGVCGGLAAYFKIDPSIIRVIFVVFTFSGGAGILLYILLWIILPSRPLNYAITTNRLYRNPDEKVLAGVASGIAAYFNIAVWIPRLIFALPLVTGIISSLFRSAFWFDVDPFPGYIFGSFGGTLFIIYAVLWAVIPEAKTASEKLAMRGKKVDLNSIKNTIQDDLGGFKHKAEKWGAEFSQKAKEFGTEFSETVNSKGKEFGTEAGNFSRNSGSKLLNMIGILFKAFFLFIAGIVAFSLLIALLAILVTSAGAFPLKDFFLDGFWQNTLAWATLLLFLFVPVIGIVIWIIRRIMGVKSPNNILRWGFGGLWTLGIASAVVLIALFSRNFNSRARDKSDIAIVQPSGNKLIIKVADNKVKTISNWVKFGNLINLEGDSIVFNNINLRVSKSDDAQYHISYNKYSHGVDETTAWKNLAGINYGLIQQDSLIYLNRGFSLSKNSRFRNQGVIVNIQIPVGKKIVFDETVNRRLEWINFKSNNYDIEWNNDWESNDFRGYNSNIEYIMTVGGLERANKQEKDPQNLNEKIEEYNKSKEELKEEYERKKREMEELKRELDKPLDTGVLKNQKVTMLQKKPSNQHPTEKRKTEDGDAFDALTLGSGMSLLSIQS
jgi:phage shock protein PspC (stress-responsive transcriptional regulator)